MDIIYASGFFRNQVSIKSIFIKNSDNILKFEGKRLIVESRSRSYEFISIRHNADYKTILKNRGIVVNNASVILSEAYSFVN